MYVCISTFRFTVPQYSRSLTVDDHDDHRRHRIFLLLVVLLVVLVVVVVFTVHHHHVHGARTTRRTYTYVSLFVCFFVSLSLLSLSLNLQQQHGSMAAWQHGSMAATLYPTTSREGGGGTRARTSPTRHALLASFRPYH